MESANRATQQSRAIKLQRTYEFVKQLMLKRGRPYAKKHGDHYVVNARHGRAYLSLDSWNGYINLIRESCEQGPVYETFYRGKLMGAPWFVERAESGKSDRYLAHLVNAYKFILQNT